MSEPRTAGRLARWTATVAGLGNVPFAPGTIGSLAGVLLAWGSHAAFGRWGVPALAVVATAAGIWASDRVARELGRSDPGCVVIDEVAGQAIA